MIAMMVVMMSGMLLGGAWAFLSGRKRRRDD
jgi:LPXTG-motif cell wall-anchored protein